MVSEPKDVQHFRFKQLRKLRIFRLANAETEIPEPCRLVAVSNKCGLIFVGHPTGFKVLQLSDIVGLNEDSDLIRVEAETYPCVDVPLPTAPSHLAVSCDDLTLAVSICHDQCPYICVYDVRGFAEAKIPDPFNGIRLSADPGTTVLDIAWNPAVSNMIATNLSSGSVTVYELTETSLTICGSLPPSYNAKAICWSPKGKQIIVGKGDGMLTQHKPTLQEVKTIPSPNIFENPVSVLNITWLSSFCFAVTYHYPNDSERPFLVIVNTPKNGQISYVNYDDVTYSNSDQRKPQYTTLHQPEWGVLLCSSSNSMEVGVLGVSPEDKTVWEQWCMEDSGRAELPLDGSEEVYPTGMDICYNSMKEIPLGENLTLPPMPIFFIMSTKGSLCPFHMINTGPDAASLVRQAQQLTTNGLRPGKPFFPSPIANPTTVQQSVIGDHLARPKATATSKLIAGMPPNTISNTVSLPMVFKPQPEPQSVSSTQSSPAAPTAFGSAKSPSPAPSPFTFPVGQDSQSNTRGGIMSGIPVTSTMKLNPVAAFTNQTTPMPVSYTTGTSSLVEPPTSRGILPQLSAHSQSRTVPSAFQPTSAAINKNASLSLSGMETPLKHTADGTPLPKQASKPPSEVAIAASGATSSNIFTSAILEEMTNFSKEVSELKEKTRTRPYIVASEDDKRIIKEKLIDVSNFNSAIKETTHSLNQDIHSLRLRTLEAFAALEETRSLQQRNRDPRYRQLLQTRSLDPNSRKKMKTIWQCYHYIESQIRAVHCQLDEEWENYQAMQKKKAKKLNIPSIEAIYQTVLNMQNVLTALPHRLNQLQEMLNQIKFSGMLPSKAVQAGQNPLGRETDISSLSDRLLHTKLSNTTNVVSSSLATPKQKLPAAKEAQLRKILGNRLVTPVRSSVPGNLSRLLLPNSILQVTRRQNLLTDSVLSSTAASPPPPSFSHPAMVSTPIGNSFRPVWPMTPAASLASLTAIPSATTQSPVLFTSLAARSDGPAIQVPTAVSQPRSTQGTLTQPTAQTTTARFVAGFESRQLASSTNVSAAEPQSITFSGISPSAPISSSSFINNRVSGAMTALSSSVSSNFSAQPFSFGGNANPSSVVSAKSGSGGFPLAKFPAKPFDSAFTFSSSASPSSKPSTKSLHEAEISGGLAVGVKLYQFKPVETGAAQDSSSPFSFGKQPSFTFGGSSSNGVFQFGSAKKSNNRSNSALSPTSSPKETETKEASVVKPDVTTDELKPYEPSLEDVTPPSTPTEEIENVDEENGEGSVKDGLLEQEEICAEEIVATEQLSTAEPKEGVSDPKITTSATTAIHAPLSSAAKSTSEIESSFKFELPPTSSTFVFSSASAPTVALPKSFEASGSTSAPFGTILQATNTTSAVVSSPIVAQFGSVTITPILTPSNAAALSTTVNSPVTTAGPATTAAAALGAALLAAGNSASTRPGEPNVGQIITVSPQSSAVGASGDATVLTLKLGQLPAGTTAVSTEAATTSTPSSVVGSPASSTTATVASTVPAFGTLPATIAPSTVFGAASPVLPNPVGTFGQSTPSTSATGSPIKFGQQTASTSAFGQSVPSASEFSFSQLAAATAPAAATTTTTSTGFGSTQAPATSFGFGSPGGAPLTSFAPGNTSLFGGSATTSSSSPAFGTTTASTTTAAFGQKPLFGQNSFGVPATSTFGQTASPPGQSKQLFGQTGASAFGQSSPPNVTAFGSQPSAGAVFGATGLFSGLGGQPSPENANRNVFGGVAAFGATQSPSLFGNQDRANTFSTRFGSSFSGGSFSSGGSSVAQTGFGGFQSPQQQQTSPSTTAFGGTPAFGGSPLFNAAPAFGSAPSFGNVPGSTNFGSPQAAPAAGFGSFAANNTSPSFGALAAQTPSPGFANAASPQANVPGFGTLASGNPGFGSTSFGQSPPPAFGGTTSSFGSSGNPMTWTNYR